jgi:hypothetical protein
MEVSNWLSVPSFHPESWGSDMALQEWFGNICGSTRHSSAQVKGVRSLAILVCWTIWKERNARCLKALRDKQEA